MNVNIKKMIYSAMLMAAAFLLPFLTANNTELGNAFCPMHIPVLLCGFICGPIWGAAVGFVTPLVRSFIIGAPPFPIVALPMAFELAAYALVAGLLYKLLPKKLGYIYISLSVSLVLGRVVLGIAKFIVMGVKNIPFGLEGFIAGSVIPSWPAVVLQLILIPLVITALKKGKLLPE